MLVACGSGIFAIADHVGRNKVTFARGPPCTLHPLAQVANGGVLRGILISGCLLGYSNIAFYATRLKYGGPFGTSFTWVFLARSILGTAMLEV